MGSPGKQTKPASQLPQSSAETPRSSTLQRQTEPAEQTNDNTFVETSLVLTQQGYRCAQKPLNRRSTRLFVGCLEGRRYVSGTVSSISTSWWFTREKRASSGVEISEPEPLKKAARSAPNILYFLKLRIVQKGNQTTSKQRVSRSWQSLNEQEIRKQMSARNNRRSLFVVAVFFAVFVVAIFWSEPPCPASQKKTLLSIHPWVRVRSTPIVARYAHDTLRLNVKSTPRVFLTA